MKIKFSGVSCLYGSNEVLELVVDRNTDFGVEHEDGGITNVITDGKSIYVDTETFNYEIV